MFLSAPSVLCHCKLCPRSRHHRRGGKSSSLLQLSELWWCFRLNTTGVLFGTGKAQLDSNRCLKSQDRSCSWRRPCVWVLLRAGSRSVSAWLHQGCRVQSPHGRASASRASVSCTAGAV